MKKISINLYRVFIGFSLLTFSTPALGQANTCITNANKANSACVKRAVKPNSTTTITDCSSTHSAALKRCGFKKKKTQAEKESRKTTLEMKKKSLEIGK